AARGSRSGTEEAPRSASSSRGTLGSSPRPTPVERGHAPVRTTADATAVRSDGGPGRHDGMIDGGRTDLGGASRGADTAHAVLEPFRVDGRELLPLRGDVVLVEDGRDRACGLACPAV